MQKHKIVFILLVLLTWGNAYAQGDYEVRTEGKRVTVLCDNEPVLTRTFLYKIVEVIYHRGYVYVFFNKNLLLDQRVCIINLQTKNKKWCSLPGKIVAKTFEPEDLAIIQLEDGTFYAFYSTIGFIGILKYTFNDKVAYKKYTDHVPCIQIGLQNGEFYYFYLPLKGFIDKPSAFFKFHSPVVFSKYFGGPPIFFKECLGPWLILLENNDFYVFRDNKVAFQCSVSCHAIHKNRMIICSKDDNKMYVFSTASGSLLDEYQFDNEIHSIQLDILGKDVFGKNEKYVTLFCENNIVHVMHRSWRKKFFSYQFECPVTIRLTKQVNTIYLQAIAKNKMFVFHINTPEPIIEQQFDDAFLDKAIFFWSHDFLCCLNGGKGYVFSLHNEHIKRGLVCTVEDKSLQTKNIVYAKFKDEFLLLGLKDSSLYLYALDGKHCKIISRVNVDECKNMPTLDRLYSFTYKDGYLLFYFSRLPNIYIIKINGDHIESSIKIIDDLWFPDINYCKKQGGIWYVALRRILYIFDSNAEKHASFTREHALFNTRYFTNLDGDNLISTVYIRYHNDLVYVGRENKRLYVFKMGETRPLLSVQLDDQVVYAEYQDGLLFLGLKNKKFYMYNTKAGKMILSTKFESRICCGANDEDFMCVGFENNKCYIGDWEGKQDYWLRFGGAITAMRREDDNKKMLDVYTQEDTLPYLFNLADCVRQYVGPGVNKRNVFQYKVSERKKDRKERIRFLYKKYEEDDKMLPDKKILLLNKKLKRYVPLFLLMQ